MSIGMYYFDPNVMIPSSRSDVFHFHQLACRNKMWEFSFTGEDVDVQAVMDGLDIDRNGEDPSEIDDDTRAMMKEAELANAGCAKLDVYDEEEE